MVRKMKADRNTRKRFVIVILIAVIVTAVLFIFGIISPLAAIFAVPIFVVALLIFFGLAAKAQETEDDQKGQNPADADNPEER
jgi:heme O synthase-like polyprenyltransferase